MTEILIILGIALVILGPEKLPKLARTIGKWMRELRRVTTDLKSAVEVDELRSTLQNPLYEPPRRSYKDPYKLAAEEDRREKAKTKAAASLAAASAATASSDDVITDEEDEELEDEFIPYGAHDEEDELDDVPLYDHTRAAGPPGVVAASGTAFDRNIDIVPLRAIAWDDLEAGGAVERQSLPETPLELLGGLKVVPLA